MTIDPYRSAAELDPNPWCARSLVEPGACAGCRSFKPEPARFAASILEGARAHGGRSPARSPWARALMVTSLGLVAGVGGAVLALAVARKGAPEPQTPAQLDGAPVTQERAPVVESRGPRLGHRHADREAAPHHPRPPANEHRHHAPPPAARNAAAPVIDLPPPIQPAARTADAVYRMAEAQQRAGVDLTLLRATVPRPAIDSLGWASIAARIRPEAPAGGFGTKSVRVVDLGPAGAGPMEPRSFIGLEVGDRITAVDGWPLESPEAARRAYEEAAKAEDVTLELWRGTRRIILRVAVAPAPLAPSHGSLPR